MRAQPDGWRHAIAQESNTILTRSTASGFQKIIQIRKTGMVLCVDYHRDVKIPEVHGTISSWVGPMPPRHPRAVSLRRGQVSATPPTPPPRSSARRKALGPIVHGCQGNLRTLHCLGNVSEKAAVFRGRCGLVGKESLWSKVEILKCPDRGRFLVSQNTSDSSLSCKVPASRQSSRSQIREQERNVHGAQGTPESRCYSIGASHYNWFATAGCMSGSFA